MKKKYVVLINLIIFFLKVNGQYIQSNKILYEVNNYFPGSFGNGMTFAFDEYGKAYFAIREKECFFCQIEGYYGYYNPYDNLKLVKTYGDPGYLHKIFPSHLTNAYAINTNLGFFKLTKSSNLTFLNIAWNKPIDNPFFVYYTYADEDYLSNVYVLKTDSIKKYDSTGVLLWQHAGGGNIIKVDKANNYYVASALLAKYDSSGSFIWSANYNASGMLIAESGNVLLNTNGVTKIDSSGGLIFQNNTVQADYIAMDKNENIYYTTGNTVSKMDSAGSQVLWTTSLGNDVIIKDIGVDSLFNVYIMCDETNQPFGFVPPNYFFEDDSILGASYYLFLVKINSTLLTDSVITQSVSPHSVCTGSTINISYRCFLQQFPAAGFQVELSDNLGSFSNPYILDTISGSQHSVTIPNSIPTGIGYRLRLIPLGNNSSIIIPNQNGSFIIINSTSPVVINTLPDTICISSALLVLSAQPLGGVFSGTGVNGNTFNPGLAGLGMHTITYKVCNDSTSILIWVDVCSGFSDLSTDIFTISPNPVQDELVIKGRLNYLPVRIKIYDLTGRLLSDNKIDSEEERINIKSLQQGIYYVKLIMNGEECVKRIMKY